jgi:hypothetical protein
MQSIGYYKRHSYAHVKKTPYPTTHIISYTMCMVKEAAQAEQNRGNS